MSGTISAAIGRTSIENAGGRLGAPWNHLHDFCYRADGVERDRPGNPENHAPASAIDLLRQPPEGFPGRRAGAWPRSSQNADPHSETR
jgi:hypothetical protein